MSPKPNYALIGFVMLLLFVLSAVFILWIYGYRGRGKFRTYVILTEESVSGVRVGSPVKYKGIDVGKVERMGIYKKDPSVVIIYLKVDSSVPVHRDTTAKIIPMGITGLAYIGISGGREGEPYYVKIEGKRYPLIRLELSGFQKVSRSLPEVMAKVDELVSRMNRFFSDKNIKNTANAIEKLVALEDRLMVLSRKSEYLLEDYQKTAENVDRLLKRLHSSLDALDTLIFHMDNRTLNQIEDLIFQARDTLYRLKGLIGELEANPSVVIYGYPAKPGPGEGR